VYVVEEEGGGRDIVCLTFLSTVITSNVKLKAVTSEALAAGKDYRRLISETKRLLLMSPTYLLPLQAIVKYFVDNDDPLCNSIEELRHILATTTHSLMVNIYSIFYMKILCLHV